MSAQDCVNPVQFYHGTAAAFKPGDMITPGHSTGRIGQGPTGYVFAARDQGTAASYSRSALPFTDETTPSYTYKVEPTGKFEKDPGEHNAIRTKHPLRVVEEA